MDAGSDDDMDIVVERIGDFVGEFDDRRGVCPVDLIRTVETQDARRDRMEHRRVRSDEAAKSDHDAVACADGLDDFL